MLPSPVAVRVEIVWAIGDPAWRVSAVGSIMLREALLPVKSILIPLFWVVFPAELSVPAIVVLFVLSFPTIVPSPPLTLILIVP